VDELSTSKAVSSVGLQVGYKQLKHEQNETVKELVIGRDVFVSLPTGSGKSLCYAVLPAAVSVKSPLHTTLQQIFEADGAALFLALSHGCLYVCTSDTQSHTQSYILCQNSTIITFHCETEA